MDDIINKKQKKIVSWVGMLLIAVSLVFIVRRFMEAEIDFSILASPWVVAGLVAATLATSFIVMVTSMNYRSWLYNISGMAVPRPAVLEVYCSANLYKYIPSGILTVLGRNRLAVEFEELSHGKVAVSTLLEGTFFVIAAVIISMVYSFDHAISELRQIDAVPIILAVVAGIVASIALAVYLMRHRIKKLFEMPDGMSALKPLVLAKRMVAALAIATMWGIMFLLVLAIMGQPVTLSIALAVIGLLNLSWLVGFFVPVAPAGFGVREAAILIFFGGVVNDSYLLLALMAHRVVSVVGDVIAYCIAISYRHFSSPAP